MKWYNRFYLYLAWALVLGQGPFFCYASSKEIENALKLAGEKKLSEHVQWHKLMHYKQRPFWVDGEPDGEGFFLHPEGDSSPKLELIENIKTFYQDKNYQCTFPARSYWFAKMFKRKINYAHCKEFQNFVAKTRTKSVSLVFSSYYTNNPGSAFGHTFIRLNKKPLDKLNSSSELLDFGINFGANVTNANPFLYPIFGLSGYYPGIFSLVPYYYKIREYNDHESRDLWSYNLNFTPEEIFLLSAHIWEVSKTYYNYFFLTENCSYHILAILETAKPHLNMIKKLPFYIIPAETVKILYKEPDLLHSVSYRPSIYKKLMTRYKRLSVTNKKIIDNFNLETNFNDVMKLSIDDKVEVLDTLIDFIDYKFAKSILVEKGKGHEAKQKILILRSKVNKQSEKLIVSKPEDEAPHISMPTRKLSLRYGDRSDVGEFSQLKMRFALIDLVDPSFGLPKFNQNHFFSFSIRHYNSEKKIRLQHFSAVNLVSLTPINKLETPMSWKLDLGMFRYPLNDCLNCHIYGAQAGVGYTLNLYKQKILLYGFLQSYLGLSPKQDDSRLRLGPGPMIGALLVPSEYFKLNYQAFMNYDFELSSKNSSFYGQRLNMAYTFLKHFQLQFSGVDYRNYQDYEFGLGYFF